MTSKIIAIVGLSGVGKSTIISKIPSYIRFQSLSASELIKAQKETYTNHDELRFHDINDNQRLLIDGFKRKKDSSLGAIILDGHTVIETPNGLVGLPASVFGAMGVNHIIFLIEKEELIFERRARDKSRNRSTVTQAELLEIQKHAVEITTKIALELRIPLTILTADNSSELHRILSTTNK
jgi:adenylate kinase